MGHAFRSHYSFCSKELLLLLLCSACESARQTQGKQRSQHVDSHALKNMFGESGSDRFTKAQVSETAHPVGELVVSYSRPGLPLFTAAKRLAGTRSVIRCTCMHSGCAHKSKVYIVFLPFPAPNLSNHFKNGNVAAQTAQALVKCQQRPSSQSCHHWPETGLGYATSPCLCNITGSSELNLYKVNK